MDPERHTPSTDVVPPPPPGALPPQPSPLNTSGGGRAADVPGEIEGRWNWAAFLLPFLFAFAYLSPMWIALGAIPIVLGVFEDRLPGAGFASSVAVIAVGVAFARRANAVAWRARRWESVERFLRVQRWSAWCALILSIVLVIVVAAAGEDGTGTGTASPADSVSRYEEHGVAFEYPSSWTVPSDDQLTGTVPIRRNSRWVVFLAPPGPDLVTVSLLDAPPITPQQLVRVRAFFARRFSSGGAGTLRGTPTVTTLGDAKAIHFFVDGTGPLGVAMTIEVVAAASAEGLLLVRCDHESDDPYGTAEACHRLFDTFEVAGLEKGGSG